MIVYIATNRINSKMYVGQTVQELDRRKSKHIGLANAGNGFYFHRAIRKYGIKNFEWKVLRICDNIESLNAFEQYFILYYDSINNGYNQQSGGKNCRVSETTKEKMSIARTGEKNPNYGKRMSDEQKKKISQTQIERGTSKGKNHPMYSKHHTEATKKKISIAKQDISAETRQKMRESRFKYLEKQKKGNQSEI